ncbi:MAG: radical SAM protein [Actinobacteria bacterium]|nr:radical SAM protein [Actinomycetota bacterium]
MKIITDISNHPCFNSNVRHTHGRVHLPVAPRCNVKCNYCNRLFDCANEGRPGVTSRVMRPKESLAYLSAAMAANQISVAGIAGPGDPLANPEQTFNTFGLVKRKYPQLLRCLSTNGLSAITYIREIIHYASHVTLTVNAVDAEVGSRIYKWIKLGDRIHTGADAAGIMLERQLEAIRHLKRAGVIVKVNTVVIPGINEAHIEDIAMVMEQLSVDMYNAMPLYPVKGTPFGDIPEPSTADIAILRKRASAHLPQMNHCARCRADAAGLIGADFDQQPAAPTQEPAARCSAASRPAC